MNKTIKALSTVSILLVISKLFGFIREIVIAAIYGATYQTDAYNMAFNIIGFSTAIISVGVATIIIPMYNHRRVQQSQEEADSFASNILWITSLFYIAISIIGIVIAPVVVKVFAPSFGDEVAALTVKIVRIIFIFTVAANVTNILTSIAKINSKFAITVISGFPLAIFTIIITILFANKIGIYALAISYILYSLTQALLLILSIRKVFRFRAFISFTNGDMREVVKLSLPVYVSIAVWEMNAVIDRMLASGLSEGSISAMGYAAKLRALPDGVLSASIIMVMFPLMSKYAANLDFDSLKKTTAKAISLLSLALLPIIAVSLYYSGEITKIVFERGAFTPENTVLTASIFIFAVTSLIFSGVGTLLSNSFYSIQDTKSPQFAAVIMVVVNIVLNLILVRSMQAAGLTLATSISFFIYFAILFVQFRRKLGAFGGLALLKNVAKYVFATACMVPVFLLCELLRGRLPLLVFFSVAAALSLCVYAVLLWLLRADLFLEALGRARVFLRGRCTNKNNID